MNVHRPPEPGRRRALVRLVVALGPLAVIHVVVLAAEFVAERGDRLYWSLVGWMER